MTLLVQSIRQVGRIGCICLHFHESKITGSLKGEVEMFF